MNLVIKRSSPKSYIVNEGHKDFGSFFRGIFFFFGKINIFLHGELETYIYIVEEIQQFFFFLFFCGILAIENFKST